LALNGLLMGKPKTADEFSRAVVTDFTWRLRELSNLKLAISSAGIAVRPTFLRALVVMCYAHWEGHARFCGDSFLSYLTMRRLRFREISPHFYEARFFKELGSAGSMGYAQRANLINRIISSSDERFSHFPREMIDTKSNLNSGVLSEMCLVCGLDFSEFQSDTDFIDRILLKRRNEVAHGEAVFIEVIDADELVDRTQKLMRQFRDMLDNSVALRRYTVAEYR
jgi:hypothetical protein